MKKSTVFIIIGLCLALVGAILLCVGFAFGGSFHREELTEKVYDINENFKNISATASSTDIIIKPSESEKCYAVCYENSKTKYALTIKNDTLYIEETDTRKWYDYVSIGITTKDVVLYLNETEYGALTVKTASGDFECDANELSFASADLKTSSGEISFGAVVTGDISCTSSSGDIEIGNTTARALNASSASGDVSLIQFIATAKIEINTSSGSVEIEGGFADVLKVESASGKAELMLFVANSKIDMHSESGAVILDNCDAGELAVRTSSGKVRALLRSGKIFDVKSNSGNIDCPPSTADGGKCSVSTSSGSIKIEVIE